jgi:flagellar hook assembly protein FlgD
VSIDFNVPDHQIGKIVFLEIFDARGSLIRKLKHVVGGLNNQCSWDQKDNHGVKAANGMYIVKLAYGSTNLTSQFSITR